jgi:uncharacterized protein (TIRG00374 family)
MPSASSQRIAVAIVGLVFSAGFVALALHNLDFSSVVAAWHSARVLPWVPLAIVSYVVGHFVRGQRLRVLVKRETPLPLPTATNIVVVGYASNNVFPARLGELVRAGMLAERTGIPLSQSLTVTFIERLFDGMAILVLLLVATLALPQRPPWVWGVARVGSLVFGGAFAVVLVAVFLPSVVLSTASQLASALGLQPKWRDRVLALASSITSAGAVLRRPRDAVAVAVYSGAVWFFESLMFALLLPVFALPLHPSSAIIAMSVTNLGILVPSSPGFVGSFHFFCSQALVSQGVPAGTAMGYAILVHLTFYVPVTLWGAAAILWYGVQVGATAALARTAKASRQAEEMSGVPVRVIARLEPARPPRPATEFDLALTEALLTPHGDALDRATLGEVATFLAQSIQSLPARLNLMYELGMATFRFYVRMRYLRSFCGLDVERRRAVVNAWAFGRIGLLRQLFRPARSIALLAYYEKDAVAQALSPLPLLADARAAAATSQPLEANG